ncbi:MAG: hypothetical protein AAF108_08695 [Planctomycetota bacterium]
MTQADSSDSSLGPRTVVWSSLERAETVRSVIKQAGLRLVGVGGPDPQSLGGLPVELAAPACKDLRVVLSDTAADVVLLASPGDFGAHKDRDDARYALAAHQRGVRVLTLEPVPASALEMTDGRWDARPLPAADTVRFVPMTRVTKAFRTALDALEHFGVVRSMSVSSVCRSDHGSLGARVFGAIELVQTLLGTPETIFAASVGPALAHGYADQGRESLRGLSGDLAATLRFADGRVASVFCSDRAGAWTRRAVLLGQGGRIEVDDGSCRWVRPDGTVEEDSSTGTHPTGPAVIGESIRRLVSTETQALPPVDQAAVLATAQAALLSTRTGQPESPATTLRVLGRV